MNMGIFPPNWTTMFISLIAFLLLYLFLSRKIFTPLFAIIDKRKQNIERNITIAENNIKELNNLLAEQKKVLDEARILSRKILEESRMKAILKSEEILGDIKSEIVEVKVKFLEQLEKEKKEALTILEAQMEEFSSMIVFKILSK
jgi:F-type H+-transporting ATPase subunit b